MARRPSGVYSPGGYQRQRDHLQLGNDHDALGGRQRLGRRGLIEGTAPDQYEQGVGIYPPVGPDGEVAFRMKWRWPQGTTEVKAYPAVLSGRKPGYYSSNYLVDGRPIRLARWLVFDTAPSGHTPGTFLPVQLPVPPSKAKLAYSPPRSADRSRAS